MINMENIKKIEINGHYVWVDKDAKIKEGNYILMNRSFIRQCEYIDGFMVIDTTQGKHHNSVCFKIISASPELNLDGVPSYVEWLAEENMKQYDWVEDVDGRDCFIKGYQKAEKELFTENDVEKAIEMAQKTDYNSDFCSKYSTEEIIEQLKQTKK